MSPSTIERIAALVCTLIASSCRFGGPSGDPASSVVDGSAGMAGGQGGQAGNGYAGQAGSDHAGRGGSGGGSGGEGGSNTGSTDAMTDGHDDSDSDATSDGDATPDGDLDGDAGLVDIEAGGDVAADSDAVDGAPPTVCLPPSTSAVCDPVCNTGCPALFRCDITDTPLTGVCVGTLLSSATEGMPCTRTALTDDCTERLSCIEAVCRRLCYRDTDCTTSGTCCNTPVSVDGGSSGYRICAPCGP